MKIGALLTAGLLFSGTAFADSPPEQAVTDTHSRFSPGLGVWAENDVRGYEDLSGVAEALGVGVGYSWDLVSLELQFDQTAVDVAGHHPSYLKVGSDFAFITFGRLSLVGRAALSVVLDGPSCQLAPLNAVGSDCVVANRGPMIGPEIGWGARFRWSPQFDVYGSLNADIVMAYNGPRQFFFNPGVVVGVVWHPLGKEK